MKRPLAFSQRSLAIVMGAAAAALLGGGAGCAGDLDPSLLMGAGGTGGGGTGGGGTVCDAPTMVITPMCAMVGCHAAANSAGGLDLATSGVAGRLLGKPSAGAGNVLCSSNTTPYLVTGSNPATGFFLDKLKPSPPCGSPMPEIGTLSAAQTTCLNAWATGVTTGVVTQ